MDRASSKGDLAPKEIYFVENVEPFSKENSDDDYYITIYTIYSSSLRSVLHT